jgi:hypothetical protein
MELKRVAADVAAGMVAHWVLTLVTAALAIGLPAWGRIADQWSLPTMIVAGLVVLAALVIIVREANLGRRYVKSAELSLRIHADQRKPERIFSTNVGRWFSLEGVGFGVGQGGQPQRMVLNTILFITFDPWVTVGTLVVQGRNMVLPAYTTPKVDSDAAIIVFEGKLPPGELEIKLA